MGDSLLPPPSMEVEVEIFARGAKDEEEIN